MDAVASFASLRLSHDWCLVGQRRPGQGL